MSSSDTEEKEKRAFNGEDRMCSQKKQTVYLRNDELFSVAGVFGSGVGSTRDRKTGL